MWHYVGFLWIDRVDKGPDSTQDRGIRMNIIEYQLSHRSKVYVGSSKLREVCELQTPRNFFVTGFADK